MLYTPEPVRVGLLGRAAFYFDLVQDGVVVPILPDYDVIVKIALWPGMAALYELSWSGGQVVITDADVGRILVELPENVREALSSNRTYHLNFQVLAINDDVVFDGARTLIPTQQYIEQQYSPMSSLLSTRFLNTRTIINYTGNPNSLDAVATLDQAVPCQLQFISADTSGPETWILEAGANATVDGSYQRPLDYHATLNAKVWRKLG